MFNFYFAEFKFHFMRSKIPLLLKRFRNWWGILFIFILINSLIVVFLVSSSQTSSKIQQQILQANQVSSNTVRERILTKIQNLKGITPPTEIIYSPQYNLNKLEIKVGEDDVFISEKGENILKTLDKLWKKYFVQKLPDSSVPNGFESDSIPLSSPSPFREQFISFAQWYKNNIYEGFAMSSLEQTFPDLDKKSEIYRLLEFFLNKAPNYSRYKFDFRASENAILKTTLAPEKNFVEYLEFWKTLNTPSLPELKQTFENKLDGSIYGNSNAADTPWPVSNSLTPFQAWKKIQYLLELQLLKLLTVNHFPNFAQQTLANINLKDLKQKLLKQFKSTTNNPSSELTMNYIANTYTFQFKIPTTSPKKAGKTYEWKFKFHLTSDFLVESITKNELKLTHIGWFLDTWKDFPSESKPSNNLKYFAWV